MLNPTESVINKIEIDVAFQRGCYYANDNGSMGNKTIQWQVEARLIDDEDKALGGWFTLGSESLTSNNHNAMYRTYSYTVAQGRYEVRATRLDDKDETARAGHEIRWGAAKGYIVSEKNYGNVTLLAVVMRATDNLSQRSSRMVNCIVTRKLRTWSPNGGWSSPQPTRSIAWALADILKADYGARLTDNAIDLSALYQLNQIWSKRGDTFNAVFDSKLTVYEALSRTAKVGRAIAFIQGGIVRFVRDEPKIVPVALFGPRNIVKTRFLSNTLCPRKIRQTAFAWSIFRNERGKPRRLREHLRVQVRIKRPRWNYLAAQIKSKRTEKRFIWLRQTAIGGALSLLRPNLRGLCRVMAILLPLRTTWPNGDKAVKFWRKTA